MIILNFQNIFAFYRQKSGNPEKLNNVKEKTGNSKLHPYYYNENPGNRSGNMCILHGRQFINRSADLCTDQNTDMGMTSPSDNHSAVGPALRQFKDLQTRRSNSLPSIDNTTVTSNGDFASCSCGRAEVPRRQCMLGIAGFSKPRSRASRPHSQSKLITEL